MSNEDLEKLFRRFDSLIRENKLYHSHDIGLEKLARDLDTNRSYLSLAVNRVSGKNFNRYINDLRIQEVLNMVIEGRSTAFSIEGLGMQVGFANRVSFIRAFKLMTGLTPSQFIRNAQQVG